MFYRTFIRPVLFCFDPEKVHQFVFRLIKMVFKIPGIDFLVTLIYNYPDKRLNREIMGIKFANPIGLGAGFDKDAVLFNELAAFGFSFVEIGTLTPKPQPGNDKPRMFRLSIEKGLINRMGFNNNGVGAALLRLKDPGRKKNVIVGGNIGKNKETSLSEAVDDYVKCFNALFDFVDYFAINVSSPNTQGLRSLQEKEPLTKLLVTIQQLNLSKSKPKPVLLKIAPDLSYDQIDDLLEIIRDTKLTGIIATNTTIRRKGVENSPWAKETGGLSGLPLKDHTTEVIRYIRSKAEKSLVIIGVGGIFSANDALEKLKAGADLIQIYTGFIYEGPSIVNQICKGISKQKS